MPAEITGRIQPQLVLASSSMGRKELLLRLGIPFSQHAPAIDESQLAGESPEQLAVRLACAKVDAVRQGAGQAIFIGSDQVAVRGDEILGKPADRSTAIAQLVASSGKSVEFLTAVCVLDCRDGKQYRHVDVTVVSFRPISEQLATRYVDREQPLECAGSFRSESLGIALFDEIRSKDPTALIGLPLIWVAAVLARLGIEII